MLEYLKDKIKKSELEQFIIDKLKDAELDGVYAPGMKIIGIDMNTQYLDIQKDVQFLITFCYDTYIDANKTETKPSMFTKTLLITNELIVCRHAYYQEMTDTDKAELKLYNDIIAEFKKEKNI
jgi:hypothetical protein